MKRLGHLLTLLATSALCLTGCNNSARIGIVIDIGIINDSGFNQGTYEGCKDFAESNGISYQLYQPGNGANATAQDRITALETAIKNRAEIVVAPGFLFSDSIETVAKNNPDIKFIFVDGWAIGLSNVTAITYQEEQSGFFAGYAAVKDGYTKLGGVFGGDGTNPACNRFAYGYVQGAAKAALEESSKVDIKISFLYGGQFVASPELKTLASSWYDSGTEVIFSCGGAMVNSVLSAANETKDGKIIGVDADQAFLSPRIITSAIKGIAPSVKKVLRQYFDGEWDSLLGDKCQTLGVGDDATGLPTKDESWRFNKFSKAQYEAILNSVKNRQINISSDIEGVLTQQFWTNAGNDYCTISLVA